MVSAAAKDGGLTPVAEMGKIIAKVIAKHGNKVLDDRRKVMGLLRDYAPQEQRGVKLLMASFDQGNPQAFAAHGSAPQRLALDQQVNALVANSGLQNDFAQWATEAWSQGLYGKAAPAPAPSVPAEDDLTWGSEVVTAAPAAAAVPAGLAMAPSASAAPTAPAYKVQVKTEGNIKTFAMIGAAVGILAVIAWGVIDKMHIDLGGFIPQHTTGGNVPQTGETPPAAQPQETPPAAPPPQTTPQQTTQTGDPTQADGTPWVLVSADQDNTKWPTFNGATHPGGNSRNWMFSFNARAANGHIVTYEVNASLNPDLKTGTGFLRGLDLSEKDTSQFSVSPTIDISRHWDDPSKDFEVEVSPASWDKNPTNIPNICTMFGSGTSAKKFEPGVGGFCAWEVVDGKCGPVLGCGHVAP